MIPRPIFPRWFTLPQHLRAEIRRRREVTDAENALLSLGALLPWKPSASGKGEVAHVAGGYYRARLERGWFSYVYYVRFIPSPPGIEQEPDIFADAFGLSARNIAPHPYKFIADAKTACERHTATGEWG